MPVVLCKQVELFGAVGRKPKKESQKIKETKEAYSSGILNGQGIGVKIILG